MRLRRCLRSLSIHSARLSPVITVPVYRRFSDLDPLGHVNNVVYHDYLQEARVGIIGGIDGVLGPGFSQIVVDQHVHHLAPLGYAREPIQIEVWMESMKRSSYVLGYRIHDETGTVVAEATSRLAVVDPDSGRPIRIPQEIHDRLAAALDEHGVEDTARA